MNIARRLPALLVGLILVLHVFMPQAARASTTTTTKCNKSSGVCVTVTCVDGKCTVTVTESGTPPTTGKPVRPGPSPAPGGGGGLCHNTDPMNGCVPCPSADPENVDPGLAQDPVACQQWQHNLGCRTVRLSYMQTNFGTTDVNALSPAQSAQLNQQLTAAGCATVTTPGTLAEQALQELVLPVPTIDRSPAPDNHIDGTSGLPFTWLGIFTWFWSDPAPWQAPPSKTAATPDGAVWATVTATPVSLTFNPGNDDNPVVCAGPGRPWTAADGEQPPTAGGCAYEYQHVVGGAGTVTSTVTLTWSITWKGSGGAAGAFQGQTTQAQSTFLVEQMQAVNR